MSFVTPDDSTFQLKLFWAAVLRRAVFDYILFKGVGSRRREWQYAYRFIFTASEVHYKGQGLSFDDICETMDWEPDYIRRLTKKMTRADIKKMEVNGMKEVISFQDKLAMVTQNSARWAGTRCAIPKFAPYNYPPELRRCFEPKQAYRAYDRTAPSLLLRWQAEAVA